MNLQTSQASESDHGLDTAIQTCPFERLQSKAYLAPQPLNSSVPVFGQFIAWFRNTWNSVSTRWYVAPLIQQQNEFNQLVIDELHSLNVELHNLSKAQQELKQLVDEISDRLIATDRDVAVLTHDLGKVTYAVIRLDESLTRLNDSTQG